MKDKSNKKLEKKAFDNIKSERELINYIWYLKRSLIESRLLNPTFFHWIGSRNLES
jgi:hypothetical protein